MIGYLDTSAALKLVISEPETRALSGYLQHEARSSALSVVAAWLLHTELHCAANRRPEYVDATQVRGVLEVVDLVDVERADLIAAGSSPYRLRSSDAIHLAVALRVGADAIISYDEELQDAARDAGLTVVAPA